MDDQVLSAWAAIREAKRMLRDLGYFGLSDAGSPYYSKSGMMDRKIRISDHPHDRGDVSCHRLDILTHVVFLSAVPRSVVRAEVDRAHALFCEVQAQRKKVASTLK